MKTLERLNIVFATLGLTIGYWMIVSAVWKILTQQ